jgi:hypothetical protein
LQPHPGRLRACRGFSCPGQFPNRCGINWIRAKSPLLSGMRFFAAVRPNPGLRLEVILNWCDWLGSPLDQAPAGSGRPNRICVGRQLVRIPQVTEIQRLPKIAFGQVAGRPDPWISRGNTLIKPLQILAILVISRLFAVLDNLPDGGQDSRWHSGVRGGDRWRGPRRPTGGGFMTCMAICWSGVWIGLDLTQGAAEVIRRGRLSGLNA